MQKGPDDPDLCSPDGRLSSSHYTPRGLFHFKYRQSYNKSILPRRGLLRKGKRDPDHPWRDAGLPPDSLAWCCFGIEPTGLAPVCRRTPWRGAEPAGLMRTYWLDAGLPPDSLAWDCFGIEPTGLTPLRPCFRAGFPYSWDG